MTPQELAAKLNGCEYGSEIDRATEHAARADGLVVVFGASDDLIEFRGAIHDEAGAYEGGEVAVDSAGILPEFEDEAGYPDAKDRLRGWFQREPRAMTVTANWDQDGYSWTYTTEIPHETFEVMDDGERYCRGIVFRLADAEAPHV